MLATNPQTLSQIQTLLSAFVQQGGSDLFITQGCAISMKKDGQLIPMTQGELSPDTCKQLVLGLMTTAQQQQFLATKESNFAYRLADGARFRVNAFFQQGYVGSVIRMIRSDIPDFAELNLPDILTEVIQEKRGLILFVGATGSGKSSSMASLIDYRNHHSQGHIITIEDPIEFIHPHGKCLITQREVGIDTDSYDEALQNTLRQAPDVIQIGEIRTQETMEHALNFAETGHLCLSTLHANNANQAIERIVNFFPEARRAQLLMDLSLNLKAIVSQRLIPKQDDGRIAAVEIMLNTPRIADLIFKGKITELKEAMKQSAEPGMQTFDQALFTLYEEGKISYEDTLRNADSLNDLRLKLKLESQRFAQEATNEDNTSSNLSLQDS
ncbi:PilT/PilU family type 4a pilus ATPase [Hydrogenovibrio marinus]|uniref:PilT/PilU family type 4a pilus ATPase n=1 Tax=Hydrogenovibrio marinus TaxID=28885 RepID=UPI0006914648|nr:PilT/PilU family type 4a pilus ATPase [Hydrogenovibrio marinus]BBN58905.1 twitching motility protein PilU [Hydrogenovibrio marinus]